MEYKSWAQSFSETVNFVKNPKTRVPVSLPNIDATLKGGLTVGQLTFLMARPGVGKTALAGYIGVEAVKAGFVVAFASLEMSAEEVALRALSTYLNSSTDTVEFLLAQEVPDPQLMQANVDLRNLVIGDQTGPSWDGLAKWLATVREKHGKVDLLILDHLRIMERAKFNRGESERTQQLAAEAKAFAKQQDIALLAIQHVGRSSGIGDDDNDGHLPLKMTDVYYGGEMDCDMLFGLSRPELDPTITEAERYALAGLCKLQLLKNRNGQFNIPGWYIKWDLPRMVFNECEYPVTYLNERQLNGASAR